MFEGFIARVVAKCVVAVALLFVALSANAQVSVERGPLQLTIEGYGNLTTGFADRNARTDNAEGRDLRFDGAVRALVRSRSESGPDLGLRVVVESSPERDVDLAEASVLLFGRGGRLELGERAGLPDVLLGYAPNNFTFTGAEFGPASGPSLDPGGGLQSSFLSPAVAAPLRELAVLGFAASLSDDRSSKLVYVSPKWHGWLAGLSYAPDATDPDFDHLVQAGLTHDTYWNENVLHLGGSYSFAKARGSLAPTGDLHSANLGATLVLDYDWMFGASITYNRTIGGNMPDAVGAVVSVNYNRGPWTLGAYAQQTWGDGALRPEGNQQLRAYEAGVSYRASTKLRVFGAWYSFDLNGLPLAREREHGNLFLFGLRATL